MRKLLIILIVGLAAALTITSIGVSLAPDTQGLLLVLEAQVTSKALRNGDRGEGVAHLQRLLESLGFTPGPIDGIFGPLTESAVRRYQAGAGVTVDGIFGRQSLMASMPQTVKPVAAHTFGLTFNGKVDASLLPEVLAIVNRHGFGATFFIPGEDAEHNPDQVLSVVEAGHKVAPLGFAEVDMVRLTPHLITSQTRMARRSIAKLTGEEPKFFRPPFGRYTNGMTNLIEQEGLKMVMWTNVTTRASAPNWPAQLAESVYPGAVVMLRHDLPDTVDRLDLALTELGRAGYRGVSLTELYDKISATTRIGARFVDRFPHS